MKHTEHIIERLKNLCGLSVVEVDVPSDMPTEGVLQDAVSGKTVFAVACGNESYAFQMDGVSQSDLVTATLAREYASSVIAKSSAAIDPLRAYLEGSGSAPQGVHMGKSDYYVFAVYSESHSKSIREYISTMADNFDFVVDMGDGITAFCKRKENDGDYQSAGEFAIVLKENLAEEIKDCVKIGVGGIARGVSELPQLYRYASSALVSGAEFDPKSDIYSYKEYALIKALSGLSATEMEKYVKTVLDKNYREVLADEELMVAADAFIKHSLNISEASRSMYVHRNTLIYRLDKIEKLTGLNIRSFNDAMTFRVACLVYKML